MPACHGMPAAALHPGPLTGPGKAAENAPSPWPGHHTGEQEDALGFSLPSGTICGTNQPMADPSVFQNKQPFFYLKNHFPDKEYKMQQTAKTSQIPF